MGRVPTSEQRFVWHPWIAAAAAFHLIAAFVLLPVTSHPYDFAAITGPTEAWLRWGVSPFLNWKFGADYMTLTLLAQFFRASLVWLGAPGIVAVHVAWKLPLVAADMMVAAVLYKLGTTIAPARAEAITILWLVNPAVLWVSAGHGQVESIAILTLMAALLLSLKRHQLAAGIVTGLGVGIEYFPLAAAVAVLILWRSDAIGRSPAVLIRYSVGLGLALLVCFGPVVIDPVGRSSLATGLISSTGATNAPSSLLTLWTWVSYRGASNWPAAYVAFGLVASGIGLWMARRVRNVAVAYVATILIGALLLDVNALPQFAVVAVAAMLVLALVAPVSGMVVAGLSVAAITTYFIFLDAGASSANAFFYDIWAPNPPDLWPVPENGRLALTLGLLFSLGLAVAAGWSLFRVGRQEPRLQWRWPAAISSIVCVVIAVWALQPVLWTLAARSLPSTSPPDFGQFIQTRSGVAVPITSGAFDFEYSSTAVLAATTSRIRPAAGFQISMGDIVDHETAGLPRLSSDWGTQAVTIPRWALQKTTVSTLWIELLLGSRQWPTASSASSWPHLSVGGLDVSANDIRVVASRSALTGWAVVDFCVPSRLVSDSGVLDIYPLPKSLLWNGSAVGPWVRILPDEGSLPTLVDSTVMPVGYQVDSAGHGVALGLPLRESYVVDLSGGDLPIAVGTPVIVWPKTQPSWLQDNTDRVLGSLFGLAILGAIVISVWGLAGQNRLGSNASERSTSPLPIASGHTVAPR